MKVLTKNKYPKGHYLYNKDEVILVTPTKAWTREDIWNLGAPERCVIKSRKDLDIKLLAALKGPFVKMEDSFFYKKIQELKDGNLVAA